MVTGAFIRYLGEKAGRIITNEFTESIKKKVPTYAAKGLEETELLHIGWNVLKTTVYTSAGLWILSVMHSLMERNLGP
jgi:hypothetical protein